VPRLNQPGGNITHFLLQRRRSGIQATGAPSRGSTEGCRDWCASQPDYDVCPVAGAKCAGAGARPWAAGIHRERW
jgi:hypothetical protein